MRRPAVLLSIAVLAGAVLLWWRRRLTTPDVPLGAGPQATSPVASAPVPGTRFVSVPWDLVTAPADEPTLTIRYRDGEQMELDRIDAQETPTQVFVTVLMRWCPPAGSSFAFGEEHEAVVPLSQPLAERELVHAPVDLPTAPPLYP